MRSDAINKKCEIPGCDRIAIHATAPVLCCNMHYRRWWRYGQFSPRKKGKGTLRKMGKLCYRVITYNGKQRFEHRVVMEQFIGRELKPFPHEVIHHKNGDTLDNRIENLQIMTCSDHVKLHLKKRYK